MADTRHVFCFMADVSHFQNDECLCSSRSVPLFRFLSRWNGKLPSMAFRVPTPDVSVVGLTADQEHPKVHRCGGRVHRHRNLQDLISGRRGLCFC